MTLSEFQAKTDKLELENTKITAFQTNFAIK